MSDKTKQTGIIPGQIEGRVSDGKCSVSIDLKQLSRGKGIEPAVVVGAVEDAIALATRKYYKNPGRNMRAEMDR